MYRSRAAWTPCSPFTFVRDYEMSLWWRCGACMYGYVYVVWRFVLWDRGNFVNFAVAETNNGEIEKTMIPKKIHMCWLSGDPFPADIRKCIATWKKVMPDYEVKVWNLENFNLDAAPRYVQEAVRRRKWAFAADYIRMYALYHEGGIYLDSDVAVLKRFDDFLSHRFFSSLEYHPSQIEKDGAMDMIDSEGNRIKDGFVSGIMIQAAVMGAEKGSSFVKDVIDWYADKEFINEHGELAVSVVAPQIYARVAEDYGFIYKDKDQHLKDDVCIYRSEIFAGNKHEVTPASYAIHYCAHSWHPTPLEKLSRMWIKLKKKYKTRNSNG